MTKKKHNNKNLSNIIEETDENITLKNENNSKISKTKQNSSTFRNELEVENEIDDIIKFALLINKKDNKLSYCALNDKVFAKFGRNRNSFKALEIIKSRNYIDEEKNINLLKFNLETKLYGKEYILNELKQLRFNPILIENLTFNKENETLKAKTLIEMKESHKNNKNFKTYKSYLFNLLKKHGFEEVIIYNLLDKVQKDTVLENCLLNSEYEKIKSKVNKKSLYTENKKRELIVRKLISKGYNYNDIYFLLEEEE